MGLLKIGVDVDDVLADTNPSLCRYLNVEFGFDLTPASFKRGYGISQVMGWPPGTSAPYLRAYEKSQGFENLDVVPGSQEGVAELAKLYALHPISARHDGLRDLTEKWIAKKYPEMFDSVRFTNGIHGRTHMKTDLCKELDVKVMVEDHPVYATHLSESGIYVVLLNNHWNEEITENSHLKRVMGWEEVVPAVHQFADLARAA